MCTHIDTSEIYIYIWQLPINRCPFCVSLVIKGLLYTRGALPLEPLAELRGRPPNAPAPRGTPAVQTPGAVAWPLCCLTDRQNQIRRPRRPPCHPGSRPAAARSHNHPATHRPSHPPIYPRSTENPKGGKSQNLSKTYGRSMILASSSLPGGHLGRIFGAS